MRVFVAVLLSAMLFGACGLPVPHVPSVALTVDSVGAADIFSQGDTLDLLTFGSPRGQRELTYRRSTDGGRSWSTPVVVGTPGSGIVDHKPGMGPQVAAIGDTVVVLWTTPGTSPWGDGPLATAVSIDGGRTWRSGANPADDGSTLGHQFLDLAASQGEGFTAVWLDSRDGGVGLRAASSSDGLSWGANHSIDTVTCECCWNRALAIPGAGTAVLYRDASPRDMALAWRVQAPGAKALWDRRSTVGAFGWTIDACPHVGGGLAGVAGPRGLTLHATVWSGHDSHTGVSRLRSTDGGRSWETPVRLGTAAARYADIAARGHQVVAVWTEPSGGQGSLQGTASQDNGVSWSAPFVWPVTRNASHPQVVSTAAGFLVFWLEPADHGRLQIRSLPTDRANSQ
jgi:hypothetical protein